MHLKKKKKLKYICNHQLLHTLQGKNVNQKAPNVKQRCETKMKTFSHVPPNGSVLLFQNDQVNHFLFLS